MTDTALPTTPTPTVPRPAGQPVSMAQWFVEFALTVSFLLLIAGLCLPAISISSLGIIGREYSILEGIDRFFRNGQELIGAVVLFFSVILPLAKIIAGFIALRQWNQHGRAARGALRFLVFISKWAMADVFVLALTILIINGQLITSADLRPGVAFFTAGVLLSAACMLGIKWVVSPPKSA